MTNVAEGAAVPIAGVLTVTCGETVLLPVGGQLFLVTAVPPGAPSGPPPDDDPGTSGGGDKKSTTILDVLRTGQSQVQKPPIKYGSGGQTMIFNEETSTNVNIPRIDLAQAGELLSGLSMNDVDEMFFLHAPGNFSLYVPAGEFEPETLKVLTDVPRSKGRTSVAGT
jgi:hypothetical protein